jgi:hypothetical protein
VSTELIAGIVALILSLVGGGVGWSQVRKHGEAKREIKQLRAEIKALEFEIMSLVNPAPDVDQSGRLLRSLSDDAA